MEEGGGGGEGRGGEEKPHKCISCIMSPCLCRSIRWSVGRSRIALVKPVAKSTRVPSTLLHHASTHVYLSTHLHLHLHRTTFPHICILHPIYYPHIYPANLLPTLNYHLRHHPPHFTHTYIPQPAQPSAVSPTHLTPNAHSLLQHINPEILHISSLAFFLFSFHTSTCVRLLDLRSLYFVRVQVKNSSWLALS